MKHLLIASGDDIFIALIKQFLINQISPVSIKVYHSFTEIKEVSSVSGVTGVILDDYIIGFSSLEIISFLRFEKKMICPVVHFSTEGLKNEEKALLRGATRCFAKPFNPSELVPHLIKLFGNVKTG